MLTQKVNCMMVLDTHYMNRGGLDIQPVIFVDSLELYKLIAYSNILSKNNVQMLDPLIDPLVLSLNHQSCWVDTGHSYKSELIMMLMHLIRCI